MSEMRSDDPEVTGNVLSAMESDIRGAAGVSKVALGEPDDERERNARAMFVSVLS